MPGPALHHMIADRIKTQIERGAGIGKGLSPAELEQIQSLLADHRNLPYFFLGCQGPDFFFFNTKDIDPKIGELVKIYYDVYEAIEEFKKKTEGNIGQTWYNGSLRSRRRSN